MKNAVLKDLQYSQETPVPELLFNKVAGLKDWNFIKRRLQRMCFPVNITQSFLLVRFSSFTI